MGDRWVIGIMVLGFESITFEPVDNLFDELIAQTYKILLSKAPTTR